MVLEKIIDHTSKLTVSKSWRKYHFSVDSFDVEMAKFTSFAEEQRDRSSPPPVNTRAAAAGPGAHSLVVFCFGVCEDVRLQVGRLCKFFAAAIKRTYIRAISSVDAYMCAQVKVQREPFTAALKRALRKDKDESML